MSASTLVSDNGNNGNVATNTLDRDWSTRWSNKQSVAWVQYDLGNVRSVNAIRIAWYRGDQRVYDFDVLAGETPDSLKTVLSGENSCGKSTQYETYSFAATKARYLRIVGHGNSVTTWNSILEVEARGSTQMSCSARYGAAKGFALCAESATTCEFSATLGGNKNCHDVCGQHGGGCLEQHGNGSNACGKSGKKSCSSTGKWDDICVCTK